MQRISLIIISFLTTLGLWAGVSVGSLTVEGQVNPLSIETQHPRLSWIITSDQRDVMQTAYHVLVASSPEKLAAGEGDLWDSGRVASDQSVWVE